MILLKHTKENGIANVTNWINNHLVKAFRWSILRIKEDFFTFRYWLTLFDSSQRHHPSLSYIFCIHLSFPVGYKVSWNMIVFTSFMGECVFTHYTAYFMPEALLTTTELHYYSNVRIQLSYYCVWHKTNKRMVACSWKFLFRRKFALLRTSLGRGKLP